MAHAFLRAVPAFVATHVVSWVAQYWHWWLGRVLVNQSSPTLYPAASPLAGEKLNGPSVIMQTRQTALEILAKAAIGPDVRFCRLTRPKRCRMVELGNRP